MSTKKHQERDEKNLTIKVNDTVKLEAVLSQTAPCSLGAVVCHPMPLLGGNLHNNVVVSIAKGLNSLGITTLRFNMRGVGNSTGKGSWRGGAEREDTLACCKYLLAVGSIRKVLLVGYSYGSAIASSVVNDMDEIIGYVSISYPFGPLTLMLLGPLLDKAKTNKPKLFIIGDRDNFTGVAKFKKRVEEFPEPKATKIVEDVDHFWFGHETDILEAIKEWLEKEFVALLQYGQKTDKKDEGSQEKVRKHQY